MDRSFETPRDVVYEGRAIVAAFASRDEAAEAARALHHDGFRRTWIGVTRAAETASPETSHMTVEGESLGERIGRFFSGEREERTLHDELVRHGVGDAAARSIETQIEPNAAILTVDGANHPEFAASIIERHEGYVLAGESFAARGAMPRESGALTGSEVLGYGDPTKFARGMSIDEQGVLQLREERLNVGTERRAAGEATVGKDVVEHRQDVDVPVIREELFIERRPAGETARSAQAGEAGEIGAVAEGERIRIPLMREQAVVTKRPVVTEEVVVGKRQVAETQRVSDTTREERLRVDETPAPGTGGISGGGVSEGGAGSAGTETTNR
ncbi:MAG TPA: YsnF/AvaK domain-containing protein [Candidatus Limnocylindria bacterium]|jgi:uncharacterized protein (TIGR02271 family)|nr:YsnF/AvaK domain-containing protein [Candidatus Limnocylindria bacterium]